MDRLSHKPPFVMAKLVLDVPNVHLRQAQDSTNYSNNSRYNWLPWVLCLVLGVYGFSTLEDKSLIRQQRMMISGLEKHASFLDSTLVATVDELSNVNRSLGTCLRDLSDCNTMYAGCNISLIAAEKQAEKDAATIRLKNARLKEVTEFLEKEEKAHRASRNHLLTQKAAVKWANDSIQSLNAAILARDQVIADYDEATSFTGLFSTLFGAKKESDPHNVIASLHPQTEATHSSQLVLMKSMPETAKASFPQPGHEEKVSQVREKAQSWIPLYLLAAYLGALFLLLIVLLKRRARKQKNKFFGY